MIYAFKLRLTSYRYLKNVHPDKYVPEIEQKYTGAFGGPSKDVCLDNMQNARGGPVGFYGCHGLATQRWAYSLNG